MKKYIIGLFMSIGLFSSAQQSQDIMVITKDNNQVIEIPISSIKDVTFRTQEIDDPIQPYVPTHVPRSILVYMDANNNLNGFEQYDINEMIQAASNGDITDGRLLVFNANRNGRELLLVSEDGTQIIKSYDSDESYLSVNFMNNVLNDVKELSPSDEYGLILWGTSYGWLEDGMVEANKAPARSFGYDSNKKMNITSLHSVLYDKGLSFIFFDSSFMSSIEVLYELRDCAEIIGGCPSEDSIDGLPYHIALKYLYQTESSIEEAVKNAALASFEHYNATWQKFDCPVAYTVVKTSALENLANATKSIYYIASPEDIWSNNTEYQKFSAGSRCYYFDFKQYVDSLTEDTASLSDWQNALDQAVLYEAHTPYIWNTPLEHCCGITTYIMKSPDNASTMNYNNLQWFVDVASILCK